MLTFLNKLISWSFYALIFLVPLAFWGDTSELFELNKMWITFGLTIVIAAAWISKVILQKQITLKRTPFDIPLLIFLLSQIISTFLSMDFHTSLWGYYSRFNGGLLSLLSYIFLYFAFINNLNRSQVMIFLKWAIAGGVCVALWGLPSHFGYDPTCLLFRGTLDVSCWTNAFQPMVRIFSTMGQPDWLAAYLTLLLPLSLFFSLEKFFQKKYVSSFFFALYSLLFYLDFLYTGSRGSFVAVWVALLILFGGMLFISLRHLSSINRTSLITNRYFCFTLFSLLLLLITTFFIGTPVSQLNKFTWPGIVSHFAQKSMPKQETIKNAPQPTSFTGEFGGTDSGKIRLFVWQGALQAWLHNPIFGTGVETFAYAYYQYRPAGHNLTSEWDYLYNKAHNEYLNYLATTGIIGLFTYLTIIGFFLFLSLQTIFTFSSGEPYHLFKKHNNNRTTEELNKICTLALLASYLTILISNFFGFSVVIVNIFFFLFPGIFFVLSPLSQKAKMLSFPTREQIDFSETSVTFWVGASVVWVIACYFCIVLFTYWSADRSYALGLNYDHAGLPQDAYQPLHDAVATRPNEPVFQDELAVNDALLGAALFTQKDATNGAKLANEALQVNTMLITEHPNNIVFWKSRVRILYSLSQIDAKYLPLALQAIQKAQSLAPTDAKVSYNLGLLYAQTGNTDAAVQTLQKTTQLKADYRDAYYALGLLLHSQAVDKNGKVIHAQKEQQAVAAMRFILTRLAPTDKQTADALRTWGE